MGKSDDNTNELESYGVWVKNPDENTKNELNEGLDLPDFEEPATESFENNDYSDMFKDDSQFSTEPKEEGFADNLDSTLSEDELAHITQNSETEETVTDDFDIPSFEETNAAGDFSDGLDETLSADELANITSTNDIETTKETESEMSDIEAITTNKFDISDEIKTTIEENAETDNNTFEEITFDDIDEPAAAPKAKEETKLQEGEEEISIDDFLEEGFSDDSVASGNNGFEPGKEPKASEAKTETSIESGNEEVSLDDFLDGGFTEEAPAKSDDFVDTAPEEETPLEMDISFDDSVDSVQTEEIVNDDSALSMDDESSDEDENVEVSEPEEEVSLDDFDVPAEENKAEEAPSSTNDANIETEEVDLSDFGIDSEAEETPVTQNVEEAKKKDEVVDYDLTVGNENTFTAPVVNEIKETKETETAAPVESVSTSLLQQIVADLSGLKDEINNLKSNLQELKNKENTAVKPEIDVNLADEEEEKDTEQTQDAGGFFGNDDTDDVIALSGEELNNIFNTATVEEADAAGFKAEDDAAKQEEPVNVVEEAEPQIEETAVAESETEEIVTNENTEDNFYTDDDIEDVIDNDDLEFSYANENLEEPDLNSIETYEEETTEDLPDEITIEKDNDILIESDSSNFMDSVKDNTEMEEEGITDAKPAEAEDELQIEEAAEIEEAAAAEPESITENKDEVTEETTFDEVPVVENFDEPVIEETAVDLPSEDKIEEENFEEPVAPATEEVSFEEPVAPSTEDVSFEEPVAPATEEVSFEEPVAPSTEDDTTFASVDNIVEDKETEESEPVIEENDSDIPTVDKLLNTKFDENENNTLDSFSTLDNDLSEGNIDYLTKKDDIVLDEEKTDITPNSDLKQDIKSVLLYMDQLLENLPEEKIIEFAKSDEFVTYKKLFSDLGLS